MKKNLLFFCLMGAIALAGTSCSSSDDAEAQHEIDYGQDQGVVKTQFAINIPSTTTRMLADNTQSGSTVSFLGMKDIRLLPLSLAANTDPAGTDNCTAITLENIAKTDITSSDCHKVYSDVELSVGTNNFLFYALGANTETDKFKAGDLTLTIPTSSTTPAGITISPTKIAESTNKTAFETEMKARAAYLNDIAAVSNFESNLALASIYQQLAQPGDNRSVAGDAFKTWMQKLYTALKNKADESGTANDVKTIITNVQNKITAKYFTADNTGTLTWKTSETEATKKFPANTYNLPDGVATLTCSTETPAAPTTTPVSNGKPFSYAPADGKSVNQMKVDNIVYPACIAYYDNTTLKEANASSVTWPTTVDAWEKSTDSGYKFSGWGDFVKANTTTVALTKPVNYGVAKLETTVKAMPTTAGGTTQEDNTSPTKKDITIPTDGFPVSAILIGGQPTQLGWQYVANTGATYGNTIYDKDMPTDMAAKNNVASSTNYTLVLDNYATTTESPKIAVELTNNSGQDFVGIDGTIEKGQKFYLIGTLKVDDATNKTSITMPTDTRYPYNTIKRVFMQDFTTTANLSFSALTNAYVTIPDLRSVKLKLGLAVDLSWQTGLTFNTTIGE